MLLSNIIFFQVEAPKWGCIMAPVDLSASHGKSELCMEVQEKVHPDNFLIKSEIQYSACCLIYFFLYRNMENIAHL